MAILSQTRKNAQVKPVAEWGFFKEYFAAILFDCTILTNHEGRIFLLRVEYMANFYRVVRSLLDFSLVAKYTKYASKVRKSRPKNAKNYTKMTYRPDLWHRTYKNSSRVVGFQFLGANSSFYNQGLYPDWAIKILHNIPKLSFYIFTSERKMRLSWLVRMVQSEIMAGKCSLTCTLRLPWLWWFFNLFLNRLCNVCYVWLF